MWGYAPHQVFKGGKAGEAATREALALFEAAMQLQPSRPEARAALYNAGCCHAKLKQWQAAVDCVEEAVNEQGLKLSLALEVHRSELIARAKVQMLYKYNLVVATVSTSRGLKTERWRYGGTGRARKIAGNEVRGWLNKILL